MYICICTYTTTTRHALTHTRTHTHTYTHTHTHVQCGQHSNTHGIQHVCTSRASTLACTPLDQYYTSRAHNQVCLYQLHSIYLYYIHTWLIHICDMTHSYTWLHVSILHTSLDVRTYVCIRSHIFTHASTRAHTPWDMRQRQATRHESPKPPDLSPLLPIHIYIYIFTCIYIYIYIYIYMHLYRSLSTTSRNAYIYVCANTYTHTHTYNICICIYTYTHMHTRRHSRRDSGCYTSRAHMQVARYKSQYIHVYIYIPIYIYTYL